MYIRAQDLWPFSTNGCRSLGPLSETVGNRGGS